MTAMFDIHLASDVMSSELQRRLDELGFVKDNFIGGTTGVVHPCHYSKRPASREAFAQSWDEAISLLSTVSETEFYGYAEAEVTSGGFDTQLPWKPFVPSIPLPFRHLEYEECPPGKYKDFDIHLTVNLSSLHPEMKRILEDEIIFHYVDIEKASNKVVRVYTFQPLGVEKAPDLYNALVTYLQQAGGLEGDLKLEATYAFARFPRAAPVPPIVTKFPALTNSINTQIVKFRDYASDRWVSELIPISR